VEDTLAVALSAVFSTAEGARYVFLKNGPGFTVHAVETGIADTRYVQLLSGLDKDAEVARTRPLEFEGEMPVMTLPTLPKMKSKRDVDPLAAPMPPKDKMRPGKVRAS
jgi:hypothetical protein